MRYSEVVVFLTMKFISCFYNSRAQGVASVAKMINLPKHHGVGPKIMKMQLHRLHWLKASPDLHNIPILTLTKLVIPKHRRELLLSLSI